jgi:hypothetical protein
MGKGLEQDAWACAQAQEVARSAVDGWERRMLNSETRLSSFAAALPHVPSFNASIQLQVVRVSIERRTRAASQPLTAHIHTTHHPAQPPTGASFLPISCFIRTSGRPPGPSATPERRPQTGEKSIKKEVGGVDRRLAVHARGSFQPEDGSMAADPVSAPPRELCERPQGLWCGYSNASAGCRERERASEGRERERERERERCVCERAGRRPCRSTRSRARGRAL